MSTDCASAKMRTWFLGVVAWLLLVTQSAAFLAAHEGPQHEIDELTERIAADGPNAEWNYRRACAYIAIQSPEKALDDLRTAIQLDARHFDAHLELCKVLLSLGQLDDAMKASTHAKETFPMHARYAECAVARGDIFVAKNQWDEALAEYLLACERRPDEIDWRLKLSAVQSHLGRHEDRIVGLKEAFDRSGSVVLRTEWIESLIDGGRAQEALPWIEAELESSRWRASWLLRRARAYAQLQESRLATNDLEEAKAELSARMQGRRPSPSLLLDRGTIHAMLGDISSALRDRESAAELGAPSSPLKRLDEAIRRASQERTDEPSHIRSAPNENAMP